jgi:hypothetical protein
MLYSEIIDLFFFSEIQSLRVTSEKYSNGFLSNKKKDGSSSTYGRNVIYKHILLLLFLGQTSPK